MTLIRRDALKRTEDPAVELPAAPYAAPLARFATDSALSGCTSTSYGRVAALWPGISDGERALFATLDAAALLARCLDVVARTCDERNQAAAAGMVAALAKVAQPVAIHEGQAVQ